MNEPQGGAKRTPSQREPIRVRVEQLRHSRQRSLLGLPELAGLAASALILLAVIFAYLFFLRPAYARLDDVQLKRQETYTQLRKLQDNFKAGEGKQLTVNDINQSVVNFEANRLSSRGEGRLALLNTLNKLIRSNGLRNTAGPTYTALDPLVAGSKLASSTRTGNAKWQSLYPGLGIAVTVEGPYPNLRHFVREIETGNQFIVINSVELEKATDSNTQAAAAALETPGAEAKPSARGTLVSLRLNMAAYFRRERAPVIDSEPTTETR